MEPEVLTLALCLFPSVQLLDYAGPMDLLGFIDASQPISSGLENAPPRYTLRFTYLTPTSEAVKPTSGPVVHGTVTYDEALEKGVQFDVILVPGGAGVRPHRIPPVLLRFLQAQHARARYVLSVCTGSWALAQAGVLEGRRATTNKATFTEVVAATSKTIEWVPKARWVVDNNLWTSSGVSAGIDMIAAWLDHFVGKETTLVIRAIVGVDARAQDDDEWAEYWGLTQKK